MPSRCFPFLIIILLAGAAVCCASTIPRMSLEEIIDQSEIIAAGQVLKSSSAWDRSRQFIWTHYEIAVHDVTKGNRTQTLVVSEPGGAVDGLTQYIPGTVTFQAGEAVALFLYRTPIGYLRTVGWGQGKFTITPEQKVYSDFAHLELAGTKTAGTPVGSLNGLSVSEFKMRVTRLARSRKARP
jgi:hypothetical protein